MAGFLFAPCVSSIGSALRTGRRNISLFSEDAARMLKISRAELKLFENGVVEIPEHLLDSIFAMGLMMMHSRYIIKDYHRRMRQWQQMNEKVIDLENKIQKFDDAAKIIAQ